MMSPGPTFEPFHFPTDAEIRARERRELLERMTSPRGLHRSARESDRANRRRKLEKRTKKAQRRRR